MIDEMVEAFAAAARRCREVGSTASICTHRAAT